MLTIIKVLYVIVSLGGLTLLILKLTGRKTGLTPGIIHGFAGLIGIALLIMLASFKSSNVPVEPIIFFFIAFLIGGAVFSAKVFANKFSIWPLIIHAIFALAGLYFLFI